MASKGPKTGTKRATAPKTATRRVTKPAASKAKAAPVEEKKQAVAPTPAPKPEQPVEVVAAKVAPQAEKVAEATETVTTKTTEAAEKTAETVQKETETMATATEKTMDKSKAMFAEMNDRAKAAMEKNSQMVEEMNDFAKGNVEALVESGRITAKGFEALGQDAVEYGRKSFESTTAAFKNMASIKSPTDLFKLQSDFFRSSFDSAVAETSKQAEAMLKLAGDAAQPLSSRFAVAADKIKSAA